MKTGFASVLSGLMMLSWCVVSGTAQAQPDPPANLGPLMDTVVEVRAPGATKTGSGLIVHTHGDATEIITCWHVLTDGGAQPVPSAATVLFHGQVYIAEVGHTDQSLDLAELIVLGANLGAEAITNPYPVNPGQPELVIGSPLGMGVEITQGWISRYVVPPGKNEVMIQGSAPIYGGDSGGALFAWEEQAHRWEAVGIISGVWSHSNQDIPNINYAIPMSTVFKFLNLALPPGAF
jgi:S1-C subfamily serine protease